MKAFLTTSCFVLFLLCSALGLARDAQQPENTQSDTTFQQKGQTVASTDAIDGKSLFKKHCTSCHHRTQRLVGPALEGVRDRRDSTWIINFVRESQSMIDAGDSTGQALFMEYNQVPMPDHKFLSAEQINAIIDFVNEPEEVSAGDEQPITRPEMPAQVQYRPLDFGSFGFWLIYTAMVFMIIGWLYYMIEYTEIVKRATGDKRGEEDVPFGKQE